MTTDEAAKATKYSVRRIRQWIASGELAATKNGRDWLIEERAVRQFVKRKPKHRR